MSPQPPGPESSAVQTGGGTSRGERAQERVAACLVLTAGYVDGLALLTFGTYVSFMSGNLTRLGVSLGQAKLHEALAPGDAILSFTVGDVIGSLLIHAGLRQAHRILFGLIAVALLIALPLGAPGLGYLKISVLSIAMGMMNPALSRVGGEVVILTFVTGTLRRIASHLAQGLMRAPVPAPVGPWDSHFHRAAISARLLATFVLGALLSGVALWFTKSLALLLPAAVLLVLALRSRPEA